MKCPACGQWNRASFPRCSACGTALTEPQQSKSWEQDLKTSARTFIQVDEFGDTEAVQDDRDILAAEMAELKQRRTEGEEKQRRLRTDAARKGIAPSGRQVQSARGDTPFWAATNQQPRVIINRGPENEAAPEAPRYAYGYQDSVVYEQAPELHSTIRLPVRSRTFRRFTRILPVIIMIILAGLALFFGIKYFQERKEEAREENAAQITASILDDLAAHTILIPGEDGQQIWISELHASYIVENGYATVEVADHFWYDNKAAEVSDTMHIVMSPSVKTSGGRYRPMDPIEFDISIPDSPIALLSPDTMRTSVSTAMYSIRLTVRPGSKVYINNKDVTDTVNSSGELTYNATVQPIGDNVYDIRVRSPYCRENALKVVLYREPQEIPLDLAVDTYTSTSLSALEIKATTIPGATVEILSKYSDLNITNLDSTGEFSFMALFDKIGYNTITITSSYPGKKTSLVDYTIYYLPNPDVYTRKAWPMTQGYGELVSNISYRAEHAQVYVISGKMSSTVSEKPQMMVMYSSEDGKSQPVLLQNETKVTWVEGKEYTIYADVYGSYNGMPWLIARYTY